MICLNHTNSIKRGGVQIYCKGSLPVRNITIPDFLYNYCWKSIFKQKTGLSGEKAGQL